MSGNPDSAVSALQKLRVAPSTSPASLDEIYRTLSPGSKQFRLLELQPGEHEDEIGCRMILSDLETTSETTPIYETISYCWGDASQRGQALVNGSILDVPLSSVAALRRVRLADKPRVVWIDAICINQSRVEERNQQVAMMGEIYSHAQGNLIYLGDDDFAAAERTICEYKVRIVQKYGSWHEYFEREGTTTSEDVLAELTADLDGTACYELCTSPWFRRVWTLQEAVLARKNTISLPNSQLDLVDTIHVSLDHIKHISTLSDNNVADDEFKSLFRCYVNSRQFERYLDPRDFSKADGEDILTLMSCMSTRECLDRRDYVYGILGIAKGLSMAADYSLSETQVFQKLAVSIVKSLPAGSLEMLIFVRPEGDTSGHSDALQLPSWVPQWHIWADHMALYEEMAAAYRADTGRDFDVQEFLAGNSKDSNVLRARGISLGHTVGNPQSQPYLEAVALAVRATDHGADVTADLLQAEESVVNAYMMIRERLKQRGEFLCYSKVPSEASNGVIERQRYFTTSRGRWGLTLDYVQPLDVVAILFGSQWPVVLRPQGDRYSFVCFACVHGVMLGEAVKRHTEAGAEDDIFDII